MSVPTFIVSTGRCGSTMLARSLARLPGLLVLSEFFATIEPDGLADATMSGLDAWAMLSQPRTRTTHMFRHGLGIPEYLRQSPDGVPPLLITTLPAMCDEPERVFQELGEFVRSFAAQPLSQTYRAAFGWLCSRFQRTNWVERSGSSLRFVGELLQLFPDARFVHLCRDGRECAMSMSRHHAYRLAMIEMLIAERIGFNPFDRPVPAEARSQLGPLRRVLPDEFDRAAYDGLSVPPERFGKLWCAQVLKGLAQLRRLPPERVLTVRYEDLIREPERMLGQVVAFVCEAGPSPDLSAVCSASEWRYKPPTWVDLPSESRAQLHRVCKMGLSLLGYNRVHQGVQS